MLRIPSLVTLNGIQPRIGVSLLWQPQKPHMAYSTQCPHATRYSAHMLLDTSQVDGEVVTLTSLSLRVELLLQLVNCRATLDHRDGWRHGSSQASTVREVQWQQIGIGSAQVDAGQTVANLYTKHFTIYDQWARMWISGSNTPPEQSWNFANIYCIFLLTSYRVGSTNTKQQNTHEINGYKRKNWTTQRNFLMQLYSYLRLCSIVLTQLGELTDDKQPGISAINGLMIHTASYQEMDPTISRSLFLRSFALLMCLPRPYFLLTLADLDGETDGVSGTWSD